MTCIASDRVLHWTHDLRFRTVVHMRSDIRTDPVAHDSTSSVDRFRRLHGGPRPFVIPNPWDVGSARLLAGAGFEALATTSAGAAAAAGVPDGQLDRDAMLAHVAQIAAATDLPVSADLEAGYGDDADEVAATILAAATAGAVGGSIEDRRPDGDLYPLTEAVARVAAAVAAAGAVPGGFVLTARCELMLTDRPDLDETIARLQAYQAAGAEVLYAPGPTTASDIGAIVSAVERPVNVVVGLGPAALSVGELGDLGVRRISLGSALARTAYGSLLRAAAEMRTAGSFGFVADAVPYGELKTRLGTPRAPIADGDEMTLALPAVSP